jgi:hypothetical protein
MNRRSTTTEQYSEGRSRRCLGGASLLIGYGDDLDWHRLQELARRRHSGKYRFSVIRALP